jgi:predicted metal-dependent phosphoesterase TrpH
MPRPTFDLQAHSLYSDGALPPAQVVERAVQDGIQLLALTDHDTVDGVKEAADAAREHGIRLSYGAEISAVDGNYEDLHVCGYEIDVEAPVLLEALEDWRADRGRRIEAMVDRLRELGFAIDPAPLEKRKAEGKPLGRPHLADCVLRHPDNADRLKAEGITGKNEFFPLYIVPGAPGFVGRSRPTVPDAIDLIHEAGGVAIWAHPFWDVESPEEVIETLSRFVAKGLDGVEAFYATHTEEQTHLLCDYAAAKGLLTTGSTDFHSPDHERFNHLGGFELYGREPNLGPIGARSAHV